jgi:hypothetical protein
MESCVDEEKLKLLAELAKLERKALEKNLKHRGNRMCFHKISDENPFCSYYYVILFSVPDSFRVRRSIPDRDKKESLPFLPSLSFWSIKGSG